MQPIIEMMRPASVRAFSSRSPRVGTLAIIVAFAGTLLQPSVLFAVQPSQQQTEQLPTPPALSEDYRIGARDLLEIRVFDLAELNTSVRVSEAGTISLPLVGDLEATGLSRMALENAIEQALTRFVTNPQVSVFIREYQSQRFSIVGAVRAPGTYEMVGRKSLLEAISDAQGIDQAEAAGMITVIRPAHGGSPLAVSLRDLLEEGRAEFNITLQPGDVVNVVPKERFHIYVYGQVRQAGSFELREDITLLQAISLAGGLAPRAARNRVRVLRRKPDGTQEVIQVNLKEILDGKKPDMPIRENDVIIVPETFF